MDIDEPTTVNKRKLVSGDDHSIEVKDPKKPKIDLNPNLREKIINFIIQAHIEIRNLTGIKNINNNISVGCQIQNILFTCYTVKRQAANATRGTLHARIQNVDFTICHQGNNYTVKKEDAYTVVENAAITCGIPFIKHNQDSKENWYGIASPMLNFLAGFDLKLSELRLGHHEMKVRKEAGQSVAFKVSQYGIYGCHHVLLEGVSFPPEKRTAMAQSLGPMTAVSNLIKSDSAYSSKWETAVKRAFAHFPNIDSIIPMLRGKKSDEIRNLVHAMGDLALLTTTRQATRMFPPPTAFVSISEKDKELRNLFNFSGKGAFLFYKKMMAKKWILNGDMTDSQGAQVYYHSMFGTYKEDLSILAQVTNQGNWFTKEQLGKCMAKQNTCGKSIEFQPVKQRIYSKLCSANQTGLLSNNYTELSVQPVFSGERIQKFRDDFFDYLREKRTNTIVEKSNFNLVQELRAAIEEVTKSIEDGGRKLAMGTTKWFDVEGLTDAGVEKEIKDLVLNATGVCFLGKNR